MTGTDGLLAFLLSRQPGKGRNRVKSELARGQVTVDGRAATRHDHPLAPGQTVCVFASPVEPAVPLYGIRILHEDAHLIVVDKPAGLLTVAAGAGREHTVYRILTDHVRRDDPAARVWIVHRLDRDTSGVLVFAKSEAVKRSLQDDWNDVVLARCYTAVVEGTVTPPQGTVRTWLKEGRTLAMYVSRPGDGQEAVTHYRVIQADREYSLLDVELETGRKNQIRVHMRHIGHCVAGDRRYGASRDPLGRLGLHARLLSFRHPVTQALLSCESAIPAAFTELFDR